MNGKDFKFDGDAFDDIFSSSENDGFEEIYSDDNNNTQKKEPEKQNDQEFEDVFSGNDKADEYSTFADDYFSKEPQPPVEVPVRKPANTNVEKKPYSYNYSKSSQNKARRVSQDRIYDDVGDLYSGKQVKEKKPKKKKSAGKIIALILAVVILLTGVLGAGGYLYAQSLLKKVNYKPLKSNEFIDSSKLLSKGGVTNILLVGVDARPGESNESTRSDTMMILTIDNNNSQLKLTSFLRDTYIEIPDYKWAKLNAAQSHGGTQLLVDTIEYNYHVDIDNYMLVNFDMFTTIIDSLGGVDVEVTEKEAKYINSKDHMDVAELAAFQQDIVAGPSVHFTGAQALWYARIRYLDSDYMRTLRQRKVITAIVDKAKKTDPVTLAKMLNQIIPMIESDLSTDQMMDMGMNSVEYLKYDIAQQQIPAPDTFKSGNKNGQSVLLINLEKNRDVLKTFVFEKAAVPEETTSK